MQKMNQSKKNYVKPAVKRVKLEDKRVVSMAACKGSANNPCNEGTAKIFNLNPS